MPAWRRIVDRSKSSRPYEAVQLYLGANGNLLAAGVGYYAFFSIFPALALAGAIFGFVLQGHPEILEAIADSLNTILPGMVKTPTNPDGIISIEAPSSLALTLTGVISFAVLLYAGLGWVSALRTGIRGIFGLDKSDSNFALAKGRDLVVLATLGLAIAVSAVLTSAIGGFAQRVAEWMGFTGNGLVVGILGVAVGILIDTFIMVLLLRFLSEVRLPWRNVRLAALLGALALTVLKLAGGYLIGRATDNPLLGAVAVPVGLLFWLNLIARVVLFSAALAADHVDLVRFGGQAAQAEVSDKAHVPPSPVVRRDAPRADVGALTGSPAATSLAAVRPRQLHDRAARQARPGGRVVAAAVTAAVAAAVALGVTRRRRQRPRRPSTTAG